EALPSRAAEVGGELFPCCIEVRLTGAFSVADSGENRPAQRCVEPIELRTVPSAEILDGRMQALEADVVRQRELPPDPGLHLQELHFEHERRLHRSPPLLGKATS